MTDHPALPITRDLLLGYFLDGASPRPEWLVGMEVEKMGRDAATGRPIPYEGADASVRGVLELIAERRGGEPVLEGDHLIGLDAPWGTISLEPGGQVEWSSKPQRDLDALGREMRDHLAVMKEAEALGLRWLDVAVDPVQAVSDMPWMPKARYMIMRVHLGERGRLAHRMMTQTASIQCAYDYADPADWKRKFLAAAVLAPVATALFANSSRIDGAETGFRNYRQMIWRETDPDRCGLPPIVFEESFDIERWLDWVLDVPAIFRHRARGLVSAGAVSFRELMQISGCDAIKHEDWETHASTIFTEVRSYTYIEVRSADLQTDELCLAVPTFWTGTLYHDDALDAALAAGEGMDHASWTEAMHSAARLGLDGEYLGRPLRPIAERALSTAAHALRNGAACVGDPDRAVRQLERLAERHEIDLRT